MVVPQVHVFCTQMRGRPSTSVRQWKYKSLVHLPAAPSSASLAVVSSRGHRSTHRRAGQIGRSIEGLLGPATSHQRWKGIVIQRLGNFYPIDFRRGIMSHHLVHLLVGLTVITTSRAGGGSTSHDLIHPRSTYRIIYISIEVTEWYGGIVASLHG